MGLVCSTAARWESRYSLLCKDNISCNNVYIIKTLVFCIHILAICMTTWSWAYIRWASGFGLKTGCDNLQLAFFEKHRYSYTYEHSPLWTHTRTPYPYEHLWKTKLAWFWDSQSQSLRVPHCRWVHALLFPLWSPAPARVHHQRFVFPSSKISIFAHGVCGLLQELIPVVLLSCRIKKLEVF
jgi:hypothetical protein